MTDSSAPQSLEERIKRMIRATGPISVADYMTLCLADPQEGYYTAHRPIGQKGDFITAPEVSQLFGELIGIWMLVIWQNAGCPKPFHLVELGPGRGSLMADMVRAIASNAQALEHLTLHLVEISPTLRAQQQSCLATINNKKKWHDSLETLPKEALFIIGNEFFDCLPIHQWVSHKGNWHERVIGLDDQDRLSFGLGALRSLEPSAMSGSAPDGAILERAPASEATMSEIASLLAAHGGAGLFFDYGYDQPALGDTFQAMRQHAYADPLASPGNHDLTAHVNFSALRRCALDEIAKHPASTLTAARISTQGDFLLAMGLLQRAGQLGAGRSAETQASITTAVERLASPEQMGTLFKCLALMPAALPLPPQEQTP